MTALPPHHSDISRIGDVTVICFLEKQSPEEIIEDINIFCLGQEMSYLPDQDGRAGGDKILLDFSAVDFLTSMVLGSLVKLHEKMKAHGSMLKLSNIKPHLSAVFTVSKIDRLLKIYKDRTDALKAF